MRLTGGTKKLKGERVELRRHDRRNYPLYGEWYGDWEIWNLTSWRSSPIGPVAVERLFEEREMSSLDDSFAIHLRGEKKPLGVISLINISEPNSSADLSIIVGSEEDRQRGYGTEAIRILLDYAFDELGLCRVGLSVFQFNEQAIATYRKLGFNEEGRMRRAIRRGDTAYDAILMSILASEWKAQERH